MDLVRDIWLEADILKPVSISQLCSKFIELEELDCFDLSLQALLGELLVGELLLCAFKCSVFLLLSVEVVAECTNDGVFPLLLCVVGHLV